jgi:DNA-binding NtrC family response regulator
MQLLNRQKSGLRGDSETLLGYSEQIVALRNLIEKLSGIPGVTVLIQGEKRHRQELVARLLHGEQKSRSSRSAAHPFRKTCSIRIFGYEKGAFTNAKTTKSGIMEEAMVGHFF